MAKRVAWILAKWSIYALIVYYLWYIGFFHFLFVGLPWLITYVYSLAIEYGWNAVLRYYAHYWTLAFIGIIILIFCGFDFLWRAHRKDFLIGGEFEGRVVWLKGIREGFIYDCWDVYNFFMRSFGKKKGRVSKIRRSSNGTDPSPGTWPNPFAIPIGDPIATHYVIWVKRRWFQIRPEKFYVPRAMEIAATLYTVAIEENNVIRKPHPDVPGRWIYFMTTESIPSYDIFPQTFTDQNLELLDRSQDLVERSIMSDAETQKVDYVHGSFSVPQVHEKREILKATDETPEGSVDG